jgi:hypothetical protein
MAARDQKVGSNSDAAKGFGGNQDFGAPEADRAERDYASRSTKSQDKGGAPAHATGEGQRTSGVGGNASGPGSSSGGDLDTDFVGVGTGGAGVAASGKIHSPPGPDDAATVNPPKPDRQPPLSQPPGTTVDRSGGDVSTTGSGEGAAAANSPDSDNAAAGEISLDEAAGADNSPADNQ